MRNLLFATTLLLLSVHCAAPAGDEADETSDALREQDSAGKQADDPIEIQPKGNGDFAGAFPSPTIVRDGGTYHAWVAKQSIGGKVYNVAHAVLGADGKWKLKGDALPKLGAHAQHTGRYAVWAPAVAKIGPNHWMLYYSSTLEGTKEKKCIWRAHADSPDGPFVDDYGGPIECEGGSLWAIDPYLTEKDGTWFLSARLDEAGGINTIKIRELGDRAAHFAPGSAWHELVHNAPNSWEQPVLENAAVVKLAPKGGGDAHWFVFYSGRAWANDSYAIGYADCGTHIHGPCEKKTPNAPWLDTNAQEKLFGPGTPTFYTDEAGQTLMSIQVWEHAGGKKNEKNDGQSMRTYGVTIGDGYHPSAKLVRVDR
jgi:hypothetical protein